MGNLFNTTTFNSKTVVIGLAVIYFMTRKKEQVLFTQSKPLVTNKPAEWFTNKADQIYNLLSGATSSNSKATVASIIGELQSAQEWYALDAAFGIRDVYGWGTGEANLYSFLKDDLQNTVYWNPITAKLSIWGVMTH